MLLNLSLAQRAASRKREVFFIRVLSLFSHSFYPSFLLQVLLSRLRAIRVRAPANDRWERAKKKRRKRG